MASSTLRGFLVVADITGYTSYLNQSELEHAKDVLKTLLDLLIEHTKPPLALSGLEGDAVLSYSIDSERRAHAGERACYTTGFVAASSDRDVHRVSNLDGEDLVTLHVYSPPLAETGTYTAA